LALDQTKNQQYHSKLEMILDQETGAGHQIITYEAVRELFHSGIAVDGRIGGMTEEQYAHKLDEAQAAKDHGITTLLPEWMVPDTQCEHGLANHGLTGQQNLDKCRVYVETKLIEARHGNEMPHLGDAVHALEDSYSEGHAWRDTSDSKNPNAPIESFNVYNPLHSSDQHTPGWPDHNLGTHYEDFDRVPVGRDGELIRGTDIAAAHAVATMLKAYYEVRHQDEDHAKAAINTQVDNFYKASSSGVKVNYIKTEPWTKERDHRLELHQHEVREYYEHHLQENHPHIKNGEYPYIPHSDQRDAPHSDQLDGGLPPGGGAPLSGADLGSTLNGPDHGTPQDDHAFALPSSGHNDGAVQAGDYLAEHYGPSAT
jgi:hypothetical protein